jgi:hypothetical protein
MMRPLAFVCVATLVLGCGAGDDETLRRLGSAKADSAPLTSSSGDVRATNDTAHRDSSRTTSDLRLRVRDQDALDPSKVRKPPKPKKQKDH